MRDEKVFNPDLIVRPGLNVLESKRIRRTVWKLARPAPGGPRATSSVLAYIWVSNGVNDEKDG